MFNISVIIPLYNKANHITQAMDSVAAQSHKPVELLIIDDGSTDDGADIAKRHGETLDLNVKVIQQENQGVSAARNNGVNAATSEYVAFLDADDTWLPMFLEEMSLLIQRFPAAGFYASRYQCVVNQSTYIDAKINMNLISKNDAQNEGFLLKNYFEVAANGDLPFMVSSCLVSKTLFKQLGGFPVGEKMGEDQDLFAKVALQGDIA